MYRDGLSSGGGGLIPQCPLCELLECVADEFVFDHFVGLVLKDLSSIIYSFSCSFVVIAVFVDLISFNETCCRTVTEIKENDRVFKYFTMA